MNDTANDEAEAKQSVNEKEMQTSISLISMMTIIPESLGLQSLEARAHPPPTNNPMHPREVRFGSLHIEATCEEASPCQDHQPPEKLNASSKP